VSATPGSQRPRRKQGEGSAGHRLRSQVGMKAGRGAALGSISTAVRHTPLTAMLSPVRRAMP
jgi:hypothetical protein